MVVCYLAHCLLNANAKVDEGARCAGASMPVISLLRAHGAIIRQMPCPELAFGGTRRFWAVREQYDTPAYRAHCRRLAEPVAAGVRADLAAGARVVIIGIDGSPSMGVELTAADGGWGGLSGHARRRPVHRDAARVARRRRDGRPGGWHRPGSLRLRRATGAGEGRLDRGGGGRARCAVTAVPGG
jgi:predicted secreted protein